MNDLLEDAQLGSELEIFKSSSVGRYLYRRAHDDIINATQDLTTVKPYDTQGITDLQNKVFRANSFMVWIEEAIELGNFAVSEIEE